MLPRQDMADAEALRGALDEQETLDAAQREAAQDLRRRQKLRRKLVAQMVHDDHGGMSDLGSPVGSPGPGPGSK